MREVVLKLTSQKDLIKHQSNAVTFGQLKKEMTQVNWYGMRVVERSTKSTFQLDDAVLPQGDFILFLVPEKVKSGMVKTSGGLDKLPNIEKASYNELRSHMSWLNRNKNAKLNVAGSTEDLRKTLLKYKGKSASKAPAEVKAEAPVKEKSLPKKKEKSIPVSEDSVDVLEECRENINQTIDKLVEQVLSGSGTIQSAALQYNVEDLDNEIKKIRQALKGGGYRKIN